MKSEGCKNLTCARIDTNTTAVRQGDLRVGVAEVEIACRLLQFREFLHLFHPASLSFTTDLIKKNASCMIKTY